MSEPGSSAGITAADRERYSRQMLCEEIGAEGQARLKASAALVLGCGALGGTLASLLVRAGVGRVVIADRDVVELSNLQRQTLFDESDLGRPKAEAAASRLRAVNSGIAIEAQVTDVTSFNLERLLEGIAVVLDGTDNFETRYLINDGCVKHGTPWVYGGVLGAVGMTMTIAPGEGPCLRCLFPGAPRAGSQPTCDTHGILNTAPAMVAALQVTEAYKLLVGSPERCRGLLVYDLWSGEHRRIEVRRDARCGCCVERRFPFLLGVARTQVSSLCGRDAVQIAPAGEAPLDLERLGQRLAPAGGVRYNGSVLEFTPGEHRMVIFPDGRVLVQGTQDDALARSLYARYIGG